MLEKKEFLTHKAYNMRVLSIESTSEAGSGHPTSCLSAADIIAVTFFHAMQFDLQNCDNPNNDRFILSKGHAAPLLYAAWKELGILKREDLLKLRDIDSNLEGHPTPRFSGVDVATGSLGIGLSVGVGMALNALRRKLDYYTYVLLGDSELTEGAIWEAAEIAAYYQLDNLIAIADINELGQRGKTIDRHNLGAISKKFSSFGWKTYEVNGHDIGALVKVFDQARAEKNKKPQIILAETIKGYGISAVEGKNGFHGKVFPKDDLPVLKAELKKRFCSANYKDEDYDLPTVSHAKKLPFQRIEVDNPPYKKGEQIATRDAFGKALVEIGKRSDAVICLDAEVSNSTRTDQFAKKFPERFVECFIAEQNMVGMGLGFAARNNIPFISTFGAFLTRAFDQLRMGAISHSGLRVVGSHSGISIGEDGPSQMGLEDIAMMKVIPESIILYPCDAVSCYKLVHLMGNYQKGISYLRTTRGETPVIYDSATTFELGDFQILRQSDSDQAVIIGAGITVHEALKAYEELKKDGISVAVVDLYTVKPINEPRLQEIATRCCNCVVTVEDHYLNGGIGESVSYVLRNKSIKLTCLAVREVPRSGKPNELLAWAGIDFQAIVQAVKRII